MIKVAVSLTRDWINKEQDGCERLTYGNDDMITSCLRIGHCTKWLDIGKHDSVSCNICVVTLPNSKSYERGRIPLGELKPLFWWKTNFPNVFF